MLRTLSRALLRSLLRTKDQKKKLVDLVRSGLSDLNDEIRRMSEDEIEIEEPDKMVDLIETIIELNKQDQEGHGQLQDKSLVDYQFF